MIAINELIIEDTPSDDHLVADGFHDARGVASHEGNEDGCLVEVKEEEQLPTALSRSPNVAKDVDGRVPEDPLKTQDDLVERSETECLDCLLLERRERGRELQSPS